jgi:hypothetical protein
MITPNTSQRVSEVDELVHRMKWFETKTEQTTESMMVRLLNEMKTEIRIDQVRETSNRNEMTRT